MQSVNSDAFRCTICGTMIWAGTIHSCGGTPTLSPHPRQGGFAWNGPICYVCGTPYLGVHVCDLEPIPCPDGRPGCTVAHYGHKKPTEAAKDE